MRRCGAATGVSVAVLLCVGCGGGGGGAGTQATAAARPGCRANVRQVLADTLGTDAVRSHRVSGDAQTATCAYRAGAERLTVEIQSVAQAYMAYETASVHQVQANLGKSAATTLEVHGVGVLAAWIPSERQLIATNATRTRGGAFVRVTLRRRAKGAPPDRVVGKRVAQAALRTAPRGPG